MNFYASRAYLEVVADTYFPGRRTRIADVALGDVVLRLLVVDERRIVTDVPFLDYHQPVASEERGAVEPWHGHAPAVARAVVASEDRGRVTPGLVLSPFVDWSGFESYDAYFEFIKARHTGSIRKIRRLRRRLAEKHGPLEFTPDDRREDVLPLAFRWKSRQFRATGVDDLFANPQNVRFFECLRERDLLVASTLRANGRLLSVWLGFIHEAVWSGWIFTYDRDPELSHYSIGHQLLQSMLRHSRESGHRAFDHSVGDQNYKWLYATHARVLHAVGDPPPSVRTFIRKGLQRVGLLEPVRAARKALRRPRTS
jgi:CelD/BcsL family acetyltransferase involved in cellulose biosynthesis